MLENQSTLVEGEELEEDENGLDVRKRFCCNATTQENSIQRDYMQRMSGNGCFKTPNQG